MPSTPASPIHDAAVRIPPVGLEGTLILPPEALGIVLFAHGSGSSRLSPRNNQVAADLRAAGLGTLLFDLLTDAEAADRRNVFDIELLAERLLHATDWLYTQDVREDLPVGYFGASTGAAAALIAAARSTNPIHAVVSRGGRPDLADAALPAVSAPTLLIVGGRDYGIIELNQSAFDRLRCEKQLEIVPGATHLFEEPGTLERVSDLAADWFARHFAPGRKL